jgi:hypothetical protein
MKRFIVSNVWWMTLLGALALLIVHTLSIETVKVDHVSVILLIVILLSPFILAIKKIKIGDFEAEIDPNEVQKIKEQVSRVTDSDKPSPLPEIESVVQALKQLVESDPVLALAKLRLEIEKHLNRIYRATRKGESHDRFLTVGKLAHILSSEELLPKDVARTTRELVALCNRAMHGEDIRQEDARIIVESGTFLLYQLTQHLNEYKYTPAESTVIDQSTVDQFVNARYRMTTVTPLADGPKQNIYFFDQEALDEFLEGYNEYAEFIVEIIRVNTHNEL